MVRCRIAIYAVKRFGFAKSWRSGLWQVLGLKSCPNLRSSKPPEATLSLALAGGLLTIKKIWDAIPKPE